MSASNPTIATSGERATLPWQRALAEELVSAGVDLVTYVPDARLAGVVAELNSHRIPVRTLTREEECIAYSCGFRLAGGKPIALMQCSGLGNALNAIGSLAIPYDVGVPIILSMRGTLGERNPSQVPMGGATTPLLEALGIQAFTVSNESDILLNVQPFLTFVYATGSVAAMILDPVMGGGSEHH